ncbi:MAG: hypothetical protein Q9177_004082 [Variospora cf. flavescens]
MSWTLLVKYTVKVDECSADHDEECHRLDRAIQASFDFCQSLSTDTRNAVASFSTSKTPSSSTPLQSKHVKQIEKIGRYRDLCIFATKATSRYPELFRNLKLEQLNPYSRTRILDPFKKESVNYYVHAEIQLLTFYDLTPSLEAQAPRVLGVREEKGACVLPTQHVGIQIPTTPALLATNVDPANLLLRRTITDQKPFHLEILGMHICFETEDDKPGRITLRKNSTVPNGAIDVDAMAPGDMVDFYGEDETFPMHLDLYRTAEHSISLDLEWLPD